LIQQTGDIVYIGLTDEETEGTFRWIDGSSPSFTNFQSDVSNSESEDFIAINRAGSTGIPTLSQISGPTSGSVFPVGTTTIMYQATDACGNRETCTFTVEVEPAPMIDVESTPNNLELTCPANLNIQLSSGETERFPDWDLPTASGTCSGDVRIGQSEGPFPIHRFPAGIYEIRYEARDDCGNFANCDFIVTVPTVDAPTESVMFLRCPGNISAELNSGETGEILYWDVAEIITNCTLNSNDIPTTCMEQTISGYSYLGQFGENLYYRSNEDMLWEQAREAAINAGGELVRIESAEENAFIQQSLRSGFLYIGLTDQETEGTFRWSDGSATTYTNYEDGQSNSTNANNYLFNGWTGSWTLINTNVHASSIIEIPCSANGSNSIEQISGPDNGSFVGLGTTTIGFTGTDRCGNTSTCNFTITLTAASNDNPDTGTMDSGNPDTGTMDPENPDTGTMDPGNPDPNTMDPVTTNSGNPDPNIFDCMIRPRSVIITNGKTIGGELSHIIDGNGLQSENVSAQHESGSLYAGVWLSDGVTPTLEFDLGSTQAIDGMLLWNYSYHTWRLRVINAIGDFNYVGLGEIRFSNNCNVGGLQESEERTNSFRVGTTITTAPVNFGELSISPNPTSGRFLINLPSLSTGAVQVKIYNELGKEVYNKIAELGIQELAVDLQQHSNGIYFVRVISGTTSYNLQRIVKQ